MNKQEAVAYIHNLLDQDCPHEQIVSALLEQLHAPVELVEKFVTLTEKEYRQAKAEIPAGVQLPPEDVQPPPAVILPPWLQEAESRPPAPAAPAPSITTIPQAEAFVAAELAKDRPRAEIIEELAQQTGEPVELAARFLESLDQQGTRRKATAAVPTVAVPAAASHTPRPRRLTLEDNPELVKLTLSELGKHRKRSDVASAICERTGAEWSEVQRFVGMVETQYRGKVQARKNVFIVPFGIGICLVGLITTLASGWNILAALLPLFDPNMPGADRSAVSSSVGGLLIGIVMLAGGAYSIYRGLRAQLD